MTSLSSNNINSLKLLASLDEGRIKAITDIAIKAILNPETENELQGKEADAQIGLASLILLFARQGSVPETMKPVLRDAGIGESSINYIADQYSAKVELIRAKLATISAGYPKVVGCNWRLDYAVSNSETGSVLKPLFFVQLDLEGGSQLNFTCTEEEMTSLVSSLKEAAAEAARTKQ
ncbi:HCaRG protein [Trichomonas vaginalis G3]|uniref:COMM domain-containing protein 3 n=1 Tax=Trichomonas vaginalis (strain ATCC PRA-98 / G3) TaxID=412133 RepID=A2EBN7_TRIV3|nr:COMM domain containing protein 3 domain-containing protein [Trichomonas vaginalis G3]EAY09954.1 HCaRG protein [Trichomonas vaginalis G3]KAI5523095.1 COMM domain containing protein 3 domain-containing protein [Trichomonas vaginalis G3]|eukprot:XP_001322177.1 HCaRG protein [Trichomonas vaginalis G3]